MKRVLFPILLVTCLLAGGGVAFSIWTASAGSVQDYFESGKKYYEEKKYSEATIQLLNALKKDPRNQQALKLLAQSYFAVGDMDSGARTLNSLVEYYPDDVEANLQLGQIILGSGGNSPELFQAVRTRAEKVLSLQPDNVGGLILAGNAAAGLKDYSLAVEQYEKALSIDPKNASAFVSLGSSKAIQRNFKEAEDNFLKARSFDPKNRSVLFSLANYYIAVGDVPKAENTIKEALSVYPADFAFYSQLAQIYYQSGRVEEAVKLLQSTQREVPQDPRPSFVLSDMYTAANRPADARNVLTSMRSKFPDNVDLTIKLAANFMVDQPKRAQEEIDRILKTDAKNPFALFLLGELQFLQGNYDAAEATLNQPQIVSSRLPQVHVLLGNVSLKRGQVAEGQSRYQRALNLNPQFMPARLGLADVFLSQGRLADARVQLEQVLAANNKSVAARLLKATIDRMEKKYALAEAELLALLKEDPSSADVHHHLALYYAERGRVPEAESSLLRVIELQPNSDIPLRELINLYAQTKQPGKGIQRLNAIPEPQRQAFHYEMLGSLYSQAGDAAAAETAFKSAIEKGSTQADALLAMQYIQRGRADEGLKKLDDLIAKNPTNAAAYTTKGMIYESQARMEEATQSYSRALQLDPNADAAANNLAYILAEQGRDLETALRWAQNAKKRRPDSSAIADTLGWVYYKLGNHILARDQLLFAISKEPANPVFQYHIGMIYKDSKQDREAEAALRKAVDSTNSFKEKPLAQAALKEIR
jgi:tetratricopeptide (TPR) repeat protein